MHLTKEIPKAYCNYEEKVWLNLNLILSIMWSI